MDNGFEDIEEEYEYDGKPKKTSVRFFPDKSIATVTEISEDMKEKRIVTEGMSLDEIEEFFPPTKSNATKGQTYDLAWLVRSIIYESFRKEGESMEIGNVRNFWYTHLKKIITERLGLGETDSVLTTDNKAWGDVINSGLVTYEGMNVLGGKEQTRISTKSYSPGTLSRASWFLFLTNSSYVSSIGSIPSSRILSASAVSSQYFVSMSSFHSSVSFRYLSFKGWINLSRQSS
ncbi:unnamed protein product [marine sediment metagenome]|uniref:Uncharacterized protein n=1 Tax=marine sediment metagenome TaxID=412755 RepID=X1PR18_9ZZZZ